MILAPKPKTPKGVKYALTVPLSVLFADLELKGNLRPVFKENLGINYEREYYAMDVGALSWNYDEDLEFNRAFINGKTLSQATKDFIEAMAMTTNNLDNVSLSLKPSKNNLIEELNRYWDAYTAQMVVLASFWNVEKLLTDELIRRLKKSGHDKEIQDGLSKFFTPIKPNNFVKERQELAKLAVKFDLKKVGKPNQEAKKALKKHAEKFGFLLAPFNSGKTLTPEDLIQIINELSNQQIRKLASLDWQKPEDLNEFSNDIKELGLLAQQLAYWKSERLDVLALADYRARQLYALIAKTIGANLEKIFLMTSDEIMRSLKSQKCLVAIDILKRRSKAFCLVLHDGEIEFYQPSEPVADDATTSRTDSLLQGRGASAGAAKGKVRLLMDANEANQLQPGEIIVTTMTRPEMGSALDRAVAFVTDEGGLLCHAAIISREMKKPCVIATGNATKVLKTGDLVEVDGSKGTVKIIS